MQHMTKSMLSLVLILGVLIGGCTTPATPNAPTEEPTAAIANPASENCITQGGTISIQKRGDGGEYGICMFEDNRQCEDWALMHGDCPAGGLKVTGYVTPAAQYCVITGGEYEITGNSNTDQEQGTCSFKNGKTCDVWAYFNGECDATADAEPSSYDDPFAYCAAVETIDTPDERYTGAAMPDSIIQGMIRQEIIAADAPVEFQASAVWRCMDGQVWVCHFGANIPCQDKADTSQVPTAAMEEFCKTDPTAEFIPAAATGHATVYEWKCNEGKAEVGEQLMQVDPQGYPATFWYKLTPQQK